MNINLREKKIMSPQLKRICDYLVPIEEDLRRTKMLNFNCSMGDQNAVTGI